MDKRDDLKRMAKYAAEITENVNPADLEEIMRLSNEQCFMVHGSKGPHELIMAEGLKPVSPECGYVSFWSTGSAIFGTAFDGVSAVLSDCPFFCYGYGSFNGIDRINVAVVRYGDLVSSGLRAEHIENGKFAAGFSPNDQMHVKDTIPPRLIYYFHADVLNGEREPRTYGQICERLIAGFLLNSMRDFRPGTLRKGTYDHSSVE